MTFDPSKTEQDLVWICEIEAARRLEGATWTLDVSCYRTPHPEGKPSRVRECLKSTGVIVSYAETTLALCKTTINTWYWDAANTRLYVHTSTGAIPSGGLFLINSYFWDRIADRTIVVGGKQYRPLLDPSSLPDLTFEAKPFSTGGIAQTYGAIKALNDGWWDERLDKYVYEGKRIIIRHGKFGDLYADYIKAFDGYTGGTEWTDAVVVFETEDPRRFQE